MRYNSFPVIVTAALFYCSLPDWAHAQSPAAPASSPEQHITILGTIKRVEPGSNNILFNGDDRRSYTLDVSHAKETQPSGGHLKLTPGMRVYVSGQGRVGETITVSRLQLLPAAEPAPPPAVPLAAGTLDPLDLTVRGTVESVDLEHGAFVLRVNTHTRVIYVTADTDVSGLGGAAADGQFPVRPGQRVTTGGSLQPNGSLLAGVLTVKGDVNYRTPPGQPNRILLGPVSSAPNKLGSRDFRVRLDDGTEMKIQVPRGIPIRRLGRSISVFDLSRRDSVRMTGRMSGTDFHAARIDVLALLPDSNQGSQAPVRPGL